MGDDDLTIRQGGPADVPTVLALLDAATRWLAARGRTDQWGTDKHSTNPRRIAEITGFATSQELCLAERGGTTVAALALGEPPAHIPYCEHPHLYVRLLVADPAGPDKGAGAKLLDHARDRAREQGLDLLRVDCYRGPDRALVRYYERQGFTVAEEFTVERPDRAWPGQVLQQRI